MFPLTMTNWEKIKPITAADQEAVRVTLNLKNKVQCTFLKKENSGVPPNSLFLVILIYPVKCKAENKYWQRVFSTVAEAFGNEISCTASAVYKNNDIIETIGLHTLVKIQGMGIRMITVLSLSPAIDKIYLIDNFSAGSLYRVGNCLQSAGGKGINVSRVLKTLGADVRVLGFKAGSTGEWLEKSLADLHAETRFVSVEGQSRTNNNIIDKINNRETEILEEGPEINKEAWEAFVQSFRRSLAESQLLVCSGGLPRGVGTDTYARLIAEANKFGVITILDSSGEVLRQGIEARPYLIKPNLRELNAYFNLQLKTDSEIVEACRKIINKGVRIVVTSMGEKGAIMVSEHKAVKALPLEVEVANTIGSGDSMVAGICRGISEGLSEVEAFKLGCACAASNTEFLEIGHIDVEKVDKLMKSVVLQEMKIE